MAQPFEDWYKNMPLITKAYMSACLATTMAVYLDVVSPIHLFLNYRAIWQQHEVWRLLTTFLFFDYFGINFLFHMYFLVRHSRLLEETSFRGRTGDFFFMYLFGSLTLLVIHFAFHFFSWFPKVMFLAPSLAFMVVYIWGRRNPHITLSFLGLFNFTAPYLPWVILGFGVLLGQNPVFDLLGIVVGHIYYYLEDVYPQLTNRRILTTPGILKAFFDVPTVPVAERPGGRPWGEGQPLQQQNNVNGPPN